MSANDTMDVMDSIASPERLQSLLKETVAELDELSPKIEALEAQLARLKDLKRTRQKLITLKLSLESILANFSQPTPDDDHDAPALSLAIPGHSALPAGFWQGGTKGVPARRDSFYPEQAFHQVDQVLKQKQSLNYDIFRAIVFHGGRATTEQIRDFLVEQDIRQPQTGEPFNDVELADISSRVNYLVRKGVVQSVGKGVFESAFGWDDAGSLD